MGYSLQTPGPPPLIIYDRSLSYNVKAKVCLQLFNCGCLEVLFTLVRGVTCSKLANLRDDIICDEQLKIVQVCKIIVWFIDGWATVRWNIVVTHVSVKGCRQFHLPAIFKLVWHGKTHIETFERFSFIIRVTKYLSDCIVVLKPMKLIIFIFTFPENIIGKLFKIIHIFWLSRINGN